MVSVCVSLKATFCFEFNISVAELANIGTGFHMEAFNVSHKILLVVQRLVANATGPVLQPSRLHHRNTLFLDISTNFMLFHENWKESLNCYTCMQTALFVHSSFMSLQWSPGFKLRVANEARIWACLNVSSFNVSLNVAFVSVVFFTEATTPIFDPRLHQTAGLLLNVLCHPLLLHKDWKCCWVKCFFGKL